MDTVKFRFYNTKYILSGNYNFQILRSLLYLRTAENVGGRLLDEG